jgi:hypothetical protein
MRHVDRHLPEGKKLLCDGLGLLIDIKEKKKKKNERKYERF